MDILEDFKKVCNSILLANSGKEMHLNAFEESYKEFEGRKIPARFFGFPNVVALLYSIPDVLRVEYKFGMPYVFPVASPNTEHIVKLVMGQKKSIKKRNRFEPHNAPPPRYSQQRLRQRQQRSAQNYNSSMRSSRNDFKNTDSNQHQRQPDESWNNVNENVSTKKNSVDCDNSNIAKTERKKNQSNECTHFEKLSTQDADNRISDQSNDCVDPADGVDVRNVIANRNKLDLNEVDEDNHSNTRFVPDNMLVDGIGANEVIDDKILNTLFDSIDTSKFELHCLPDNTWHKTIAVGDVFKLLVVNVHNPYKFWFYLQSNMEAVDRITSSLDEFYCNEKDKKSYVIPAKLIKTDLVCASFCETYKQWFRAKIVDILNPDTVLVFGVDFGTTTEVKIKNLRFLHKKFAKDPIQALRGCLDCIRPANGIWVWETIEYFVETALEIPLNGTVTAVNDEEKTVYLKLSDRKNAFDIDQLLIEENHAFPTNKLLCNFIQRHYNEVYPSFEELENGSYPSLERMFSLMRDGIDYLAYQRSTINYKMLRYATIE